jgi:hypothetical protein
VKPWHVVVAILLALAAAAAAYKGFRLYRHHRMVAAQAEREKAEADRAAAAKAAAEKANPVLKPVLPVRPPYVLANMDPLDGYILGEWVGLGPFDEPGKTGAQLFDTVFPPETPAGKDLFWNSIIRGVGTWDIDLLNAFDLRNHCAGYLRTRVWVPVDQDALMECGSDDAIKVWLNGTLVHASNYARGIAPRQDIVDVHLKQGWNDVLLKVINYEAGWAFCFRLRKPDGTALDGMKVEAP